LPSLIVVTDGKPGHVNQSLGLSDALTRLRPGLAVASMPCLSRREAWVGLVRPSRLRVALREPLGDGAAPALLIGAGHPTHLSLLALRRALGCPAVVLMRPSLPVRLFDLCIEPRHDGGRETSRRWLSDGPLNRLQPAEKTDDGLVLIGGPSLHFAWDTDALVDQLAHICDGSRAWRLSTSRRTPGDFLAALRRRALPRLQIFDAAELPAGWLMEHLPRAACCWSTPDSASMVYEALTAGCAVGVLGLAPFPGSRVAAAMADLADRGLIWCFDSAGGELRLPPPAAPLAEADRCAQRIEELGWL